jgi:hypothetical protein
MSMKTSMITAMVALTSKVIQDPGLAEPHVVDRVVSKCIMPNITIVETVIIRP